MKNSYENLMGGTWLLTILQHQNTLFYYKNPKKFSAPLLQPPTAENFFEVFAGCV